MSRLFPMLLLSLLVLNPAEDRVDQLARRGQIQEDAPVRASSAIEIHAPVERVWGLLTDVNGWPSWQKDIRKAAISGELRSGTEFTWKSGTDIHSRVMLVEPFRELIWTGTAYRARAIHRWKLDRLPSGSTLVTTSESMDGFLLTVFFSSKKLEESETRWLTSLKAAAEQRTR